MEKAMLTFDKVNAHYGKIQALHDVSLHINQGEIVTLIDMQADVVQRLDLAIVRVDLVER